jgi:uncharacterized protein
LNPLRLPISSFRRKVNVDFQIVNRPNASVPLLWDHLKVDWFQDFFEETKLLDADHADFSFRLSVEPQDTLFVVNIEGSMNAHFECARSLTPFRRRVEIKDSCYFIQADAPDSASIVGDRLLECYEFSGEFLDVKEFLLDSLYNALPDRPLCIPECKGLCEECGSNLNDVSICPLASPCEKMQSILH